jgi:succinate dehydrogenase / fumarate reductase, flavoprotein subunit
VFGRRAGVGAAEYVATLAGKYPAPRAGSLDGAQRVAISPFEPPEADNVENPYTLHQELQQTMNDLVGIIRKAEEIEAALGKLAVLKQRVRKVRAEGDRQFNPGWHLALDLRNMLAVSECVARAALLRQESRGGHTRDDYPKMEAEWRQKNLICSAKDDRIDVAEQPLTSMREDLLKLFERDELAKYLTEAELKQFDDVAVEETS